MRGGTECPFAVTVSDSRGSLCVRGGFQAYFSLTTLGF